MSGLPLSASLLAVKVCSSHNTACSGFAILEGIDYALDPNRDDSMDDAVDTMNRAAYKSLTKLMEEQSHIAPQALNALMICRALERVADHATNIAEDVIFWIEGSDVRHHKSVMAQKQAAEARG